MKCKGCVGMGVRVFERETRGEWEEKNVKNCWECPAEDP